jgi:hypothetical protein
MRRIIDGKAFDTETAELLGEASWGNRGDSGRWEESLYRTRKGRYFLHGKGGPATRWAVGHPGGSYSGGSDIRALGEDEAQEWAERYLSADEYEAIWTPEEA